MGRHGPSAGYDADEQEEPGPTTRLLSQDVPAYDPETRATMAYESFPAIEDSPPPRRWGRGVPRAFRVVALLVTVSTVMLSAWPGSGTSASSSSGSHLSLFARTILSALGKPQTDSTAASAVKKPNIIFFIIDDLGLGDIDLEGASSLESITPTLAQLSQSGISLQRYYSLPICTPARASFLTGKYPLRLGMQHSVIEAAAPWGLGPENMVFPEMMKEEGYKTALVGKWHVGHYEVGMTPQTRGFDKFYGHYTGAIFRFSHYAWHACDSTYHDSPTCYFDIHSENQLVGENETFVTDLLTKRAKEVITEHRMSREDAPLFLVMSYPNVHTPNDAPAHIKADPRLQNVDVTCRRTYLADLMTVDLSVAEIVDNLKENGLYDETLLVVVSDNGADPQYCGSNFPYRGKKGSLFEGGVLVPAFITGALVPEDLQGQTYQGLMHVSDWVPTIVQGVLSSDLPSDYDTTTMDGVNQWQAILAGGTNHDFPRDEIVLNIDGYNDRASPEAAIIVGDWKLVTNSPVYGWWIPSLNHTATLYEDEVNGTETSSRSFLFNLASDPFERINLYETNQDVVDDLLTRLGKYNATGVYVPSLYADANYTEAYSAWDESGYITPFSTAEVVSDGAAASSKGAEEEMEGRGHQQEAPKLQMRGRRGNVKARLA